MHRDINSIFFTFYGTCPAQIPLIWIVSDSISALVAPSDSVRFWIFLCAWMTVE